jgi:hypothetical protein
LLIFGIGWHSLRLASPAISEREYASRLLAEFLKSSVQPNAVIVIGNPFADLPSRPVEVYQFENAGVAGARQAFEPIIPVIVAHPELKSSIMENPSSAQIDPRSSTPLSFLVESQSFDELCRAHPECDLAISLIGLPVNLSAMRSWTSGGSPRFGLLLPDWRILGDAAAIQKAFASGKLVAAVVRPPNSAAKPDFKDRYMLVHSNNVAELLSRFPQSFGL